MAHAFRLYVNPFQMILNIGGEGLPHFLFLHFYLSANTLFEVMHSVPLQDFYSLHYSMQFLYQLWTTVYPKINRCNVWKSYKTLIHLFFLVLLFKINK